MKKIRSGLLYLTVFALSLSSITPSFAANFDEEEIRVVRPRYFNKAQRFELGAQVTSVMNETFIYTFLVTGLAAYHFSESLAVEFNFSYGSSINKEDKRILFDEFEIKTQIFRTQFNSELAVQYTPIYGKWQLGSGRLIYFDTYVQAGFGSTGIEWRYDEFCDIPTNGSLPSNTTNSYNGIMLGLGQRYFVSKSQSYRIDFKFHRFSFNSLDAECNPADVRQTGQFDDAATHDTLTLHFGTSFFF